MEGSRVGGRFPREAREVEEMRRRQVRKAREKEARQEEWDEQDEHEGEEVRMEEEEKSMWDRRADIVRTNSVKLTKLVALVLNHVSNVD